MLTLLSSYDKVVSTKTKHPHKKENKIMKRMTRVNYNKDTNVTKKYICYYNADDSKGYEKVIIFQGNGLLDIFYSSYMRINNSIITKELNHYKNY